MHLWDKDVQLTLNDLLAHISYLLLFELVFVDVRWIYELALSLPVLDVTKVWGWQRVDNEAARSHFHL